MAIDIHEYDRQYTKGERLVQDSRLSDRNKALIFGYRDACLLHGTCRQVRLIRAFLILRQCGLHLDRDFDTVTRPDMERLIATLMRRRLKPATIATYKAILRRFLCWVFAPTEFPKVRQIPECVAWMTVHMRRSDEQRLRRTDLLTPAEVARLIDVTRNPRNKAFVAMLWEGGERIGEIGNLEVNALTKHEYGFLADLVGKTGGRTTLLVSSAPYLAQWLACHPFANKPHMPLWVNDHTRDPRPIRYAAFYMLLKRLFRLAGIHKPFHPHIFRHSRATWVMAKGLMTDAQARQYFGWTPSSTVLSTYSHLVDSDVHDAILRENDLAPQERKADELRPVACHRCNRLNTPTAPFCIQCASPMTEAAAFAPVNAESAKDKLLLRLATILAERGLVDEAVDEIHNAGLGPTLKRLANAPPD